VHDLLSSDLCKVFRKSRRVRSAVLVTENLYGRRISARRSRVFAISENHEERSTGASHATMDYGKFYTKMAE